MAFLSGIGGALGGVGLGAAVVEVAVDLKPLTAGLEAAKAEVAASTASMSTAAKGISTGFIIAGAAAVLGLGKAVHSTEALGTATLNLERVTGQSAESASSLLFVADKLGVSTQSLSAGFGLLSKNISKNSPALAKYGLDLTNADGSMKDFNVILGIAADKYLQLGGGLAGASFAQEVFGRGGKALIPILEQGSAGLAALEAEAQKYGLVLSQDTVEQVRSLMIAQRDLGASFQGLQVAIGTALLPTITTLVKGITEVVLVIGKIPGPVLAAIGVFVAATGAVLLVQKAIAITTAAWGPLIASMNTGAVAAYDDAAAMSALAAGLTVEEAATIGATAGNAGLAASMLSTAAAAGPLVVALGLVGGASAEANANISEIQRLFPQYASGSEDAANATYDLAAGAAAAAAALAKQKSAQDALLPGVLGLLGNEQSLATAQQTLNRDMKSGHATRQQLAADQLAVLNAQQSVNTALKDEAQKLLDSGKSSSFVITKLDALANKAGLTGSQVQKLNGYVDGLIGKLNAIPKSVQTTITIIEKHKQGGIYGAGQ